jgi:hypothetical protein
MSKAATHAGYQSQMSQSKSKVVAFIFAISFVLQYNVVFSANYLWLEYWTGASIRTTISFLTISICILILFLDLRPNRVPKTLSKALVFYFCYGIFLGAIRNSISMTMGGEAIFWIEICLYMLIFVSIAEQNLSALARFVIYYSAINSVVSIFYFWLIRDQVLVAAVVGGQRIVRLADLFAPMVLLLFVLYNATHQKKIAVQWIVPIGLVVLFGFFRSVWAALILSYVASNLIYGSGRAWIRAAVTGIIVLLFIAGFEFAYSNLFGIDNVVSGRLWAGVGTQDSLGRISSASEVLQQWLEDPMAIILGSGFGRMVWFINDFGYGEVYALQPLGSLSNYYVVFLFQMGVFGAFVYAVVILRSIRGIMVSYDPRIAKVLLFIVFYYLAQWLTFPTTIHYPVAAIIGLFAALAANAQKPKAPIPTRRFRPAKRLIENGLKNAL